MKEDPMQSNHNWPRQRKRLAKGGSENRETFQRGEARALGYRCQVVIDSQWSRQYSRYPTGGFHSGEIFSNDRRRPVTKCLP